MDEERLSPTSEHVHVASSAVTGPVAEPADTLAVADGELPPPVRIALERVSLDIAGLLHVRGVVISPIRVTGVSIRLGERRIGRATDLTQREDIAAAYNVPASHAIGFAVIVAVATDEADPEWVTAIATDAAGNFAEARHAIELPARDATAEEVPAIIGILEEAVVDDLGILTVRGWAFSKLPVTDAHVVWGDRFVGAAEIGLSRADVGAAFPDTPGAARCGFRLRVAVEDELPADNRLRVLARVGNAAVQEFVGTVEDARALARREASAAQTREGQGPASAPIARPSPALPAPMVAQVEDARVNDRGILTLRGWAVSLSPVEHVNVFCGDTPLGVAQRHMQRDDVALAHPEYPNAAQAGFLLQQEVSDEVIAERVLRVVVTSVGDITRELAVTMAVAPVIRRRTDHSGEVHFHCDSISLTESGTLTLGGWAVCASGVETIEVAVDDITSDAVELGQERPDVGNHFPQIPAARKAGFRFSEKLGRAFEGEQVVRITVRGREGEEKVVLQPVLARPVQIAGAGTVSAGGGTLLYLDSPQVKDGVMTEPVRSFLSVAGWAIADAGVSHVEVFVDDQSQGRAYYGIRREDLQAAMPDRDVLLSGFAMLIPPQIMKRGQHEVRVVVTDKLGNTLDESFTCEARAAVVAPGPWALRRKITQAEIDLQMAILERSQFKPAWSLLMPLASATALDVKRVRGTLATLRHQAYPDWQLVIPLPARADLEALRQQILAEHEDLADRVELSIVPPEMPLADLCDNDGRPGMLCLISAGDRLGDDALLELSVEAAVNRRPEFLYSDERRLDPADRQRKAFFKPDWSPDLLLSTNYIGRLWAATPALLRRVDLRLEDLERHGEYDAVLRLTERASQIIHVQKVLAGRRGRSDRPGLERRALQRAMRRRRVEGEVLPGCLPGIYRMRRKVQVEGLVSIIIPTIASRGLIKITLDSIREKTNYRNFEFIVLDNIRPTDDPEKNWWKQWIRDNADVAIEIREKFNWSRFNNRGARRARGEFLLFLNDDIEVLEGGGGWLDALLEHAQRREVGVVGPQLLYPDGKVQHAGMFLAEHVARHAFRFSPRDEPGTFGLALTQRNVISLTGACMLVRREVYDELGGFDEAHSVTNNDLDFCLRARRAGYNIVYTPYASMVHHEMVSRAKIHDIYNSARFDAEWKDLFLQGDPYFSPHLSTDSDDYLPDAERLRILTVGHPMIAHQDVKRILAIKVDHIGDFITAIPAFQHIKRQFPNAELHVMAAKASLSLAKLEPSIDHMIEFNFFHARSEKGARAMARKQLEELHERLAPLRFDVAMDLRRHGDTRHILRHTGARWLAGFDRNNEAKYLDIAVDWEGDVGREAKRVHVTDALFQLIDAVRTATRTDRRVVHSPATQEQARAALATTPAGAEVAERLFQKRVVCIHSGVGSVTRQWFPEHFAGLMDLLVGQEDVHILLIGGPDEVETVARVMSHVRRPEQVFSLVNRIGLSMLPNALLSCDLYVGNNSGPQHIAGALGVPTVGVHSGVVDATEWGPMGVYGTAITRGMACSPCYLARAIDCHRSLACLRHLRVGDVYRLCRRMLALSPSQSSSGSALDDLREGTPAARSSRSAEGPPQQRPARGRRRRLAAEAGT